ncbi:MAG: LPS assembly lipoprotein LptE [Boseongicola sp.]|nr:LPS assembly lipoprotein LptE [Boseongicola sp.]MDD9979688.1 LPS assembly lipoprotein LptE [Boseongicola sp.]
MSSFDRRVFLLSLTALAGCGFEPVYAPGSVTRDLRGRIAFLPPSDEEGFALVNRLEERLGRPEAADLTLAASIKIREQAVGFLPDGSISRYNVLGELPWQITDGDTVVLDGREESFTSYSATSTTVATRAAQRNARERLMVILADRVVTSIMAQADQI